jgi:uncharacterized protein YfaS (alpha-2-macroglobulin family)
MLAGGARVPGRALIDTLPETSLPLRADMTISVYEPGGRTTSDQVSLPVRTRDTLIGVRPGFQWNSVQENTPANFEVIALDERGRQKAVSNVTWELVFEDIDYRWYQVDNDWRYERIVNDRIVEGGKTDLTATAPFRISKALRWGSYRLTVTDPQSGAVTAYRFWSGWHITCNDQSSKNIKKYYSNYCFIQPYFKLFPDKEFWCYGCSHCYCIYYNFEYGLIYFFCKKKDWA